MSEKITYTEEVRDRIRELHDEIKDHPFWLSFDMKYHREVFELFRAVQYIFYSCPEMYAAVHVDENHIGYYKRPAYVIFRASSHDFNASFSEMTSENVADKIIGAQSYLSLVHALADDSDSAMWTFKNKEGQYVTWQAIEDPEHGWHTLTVQPKCAREKIVQGLRKKVEKINERYEKTGQVSATGTYLKALLKDIENNNEYMIKFV